MFSGFLLYIHNLSQSQKKQAGLCIEMLKILQKHLHIIPYELDFLTMDYDL
jgi:hypothetical protein